MNREDLKTAVVFDRDSCLSLTRHRWHLSPMADPERTWDDYCAAAGGDQPNPGAVRAARLHYPHHQVHVCSGSQDSAEAVTRRWLAEQHVPFDALRLRAAGDHTPNGALKARYVLELRAQGIEVVLFYEDHPDAAAEIYRLTGVPVLGVNPFYPDDAEKFRRQVFDGAGGGL